MDDLYFKKLWGKHITFSDMYLAYPRPSIAITFRKFSTAPEVSLSTALWNIAIRPKNISAFSITLKRDFLTSEQFGFYTVNVSNDQGFFAATLFIRSKGTRTCNLKNLISPHKQNISNEEINIAIYAPISLFLYACICKSFINTCKWISCPIF